MNTIIRIKENENLEEMFGVLQGTIYSGLDKTEIIRALIAEKVWSVKNQIAVNSIDPATLPIKTRQKVVKAIQSHKDGKSIRVKSGQIGTFLETLSK